MTDDDWPGIVGLVGSFVIVPGACLYAAHRWGTTSESRAGARVLLRAFDDPRTAIVLGAICGMGLFHALQVIYDEALRGDGQRVPVAQ